MKATFSPTYTSSGRSILPTDLSPFDYQPLGRVLHGPGTLDRLPEMVQSIGGTRVLLVTDPGLEHVGHPQRAAKLMTDAGYTVVIFDGVKESPTEREVVNGVAVARQHQVDAIVAVGGGSSMDCAKGINFILTNGGRMRDYKGHDKATKPMLPSIGIPTTSGTGSEAQSYALITDESSHMKMACGDKKAAFRVSILDPELTVSQPRGLTAVTGIDAIAHAIESYVCTKANPISRLYATEAFRHLEQGFPIVLSDPTNLAGRSMMQWGAHLAGMAIESSMLGVCHSCSNPLTAHYGITHGIAIGLLLPHVIRFNAPVAEARYRELVQASNMTHSGNSSASQQLADRIAKLVHAAGMPTLLRDCGVSESILSVLSDEANQQWTARFNPRPVTDREILSIYQAAW